MQKFIFLMLIFIFTALIPQPSYAISDQQLEKLEKKINQIAANRKSNMDIGIGVYHIESKKSFYVNGGKPYPLASVFKVPVMICALQKADKKELTLSDKIKMAENDKCIGGGDIQYEPAGTEFTVSLLMREMITVSDNTATDLLWKLIGADSCNKLMSSLGFKNSDIYTPNRPSYLLALGQTKEFYGKTGKQIAQIWKAKSKQQRMASINNVLSEHKGTNLKEFQKMEEISEKTSTYADDVASAEALDNLSSPYDFTQLLVKMYNGELLSKNSTAKAIAIMGDCKFNNRLPAKLPKGVKVYHKTGTICGIVNDAGIIEISPKSHAVVTVFVRNIKPGYATEAAAAIAAISKEVYDACK